MTHFFLFFSLLTFFPIFALLPFPFSRVCREKDERKEKDEKKGQWATTPFGWAICRLIHVASMWSRLIPVFYFFFRISFWNKNNLKTENESFLMIMARWAAFDWWIISGLSILSTRYLILDKEYNFLFFSSFQARCQGCGERVERGKVEGLSRPARNVGWAGQSQEWNQVLILN